MRAENSVPRDSGELDGFYLLLLLLGIPWVHWSGSHGKIHGSFLRGSSANFLKWRFSPALTKGPLARENLKSVQKSRMTLSVRSGQKTLFCYQVTVSYEQTLLDLFQPQLPHLQINSFSLLQRLNVRVKWRPSSTQAMVGSQDSIAIIVKMNLHILPLGWIKINIFLKRFFDIDHFKCLYWISYNISSVSRFGVLAERHVEP